MKFRAVLLLSVMACGAGATAIPAWAATPRSERYLADARQQLERGDPRAAIIQLRNALREDSNNLPARFELGRASLQIGDFPNAEQAFETLQAGGFEPGTVLPLLGAALLGQGKFDRVLQIFTPGERPPPLEAEVRRIRGAAQLARGRIAEAQQSFTVSLSLRASAAARLGLARVALAQGNLGAVINEAEQALAMEPGSAEALLLLAETKRQTGDVRGALADLDRAIAIDEGNSRARLLRASITIMFGRLEDANRDIDAVLSASPRNAFALYHRALARFWAGDIAAAAQILQDTQTFNNDYLPALYLQGAIQYLQNRLEQARLTLTRATQLDPRSVTAPKLLGRVLLQLGDAQQAYIVLRAALERAPDDLNLIGLMGEASLRLGRNEEAVRYFQRGVQSSAASPAMEAGLARANLMAGQRDAAVDQLERMVARDPAPGQASELLVLIYLRNNQFDRAEAAARAIKQRLPQNPSPEVYLGMIAGARADVRAAEEHFRAALAIDPNFTPAAIDLASLLITQRRLDEADTVLNGLLQREPGNLPALLAAADVAQRRNQPEQVVSRFERALRARPDATEPRVRLIAFHLSRNDPTRALAVVTDLMRTAPSDPYALQVAGEAYLAARDGMTAVATLRRLVTVAPRNPAAPVALARAQAATGDRSAAITTLNGAIAAYPGYVPALRVRVEVERDVNGPPAALALARQLQAADAASPVRQIILGDELAMSNRFAEALVAYDAAADAGRSPEAASKAFHARLRLGQEEVGVAQLRTWLERNPRMSSARFVLASHLIQQGRLDDALRETTTLVESEPGNLIYLNNLAWLYNELNDPRAMAAAERILPYARSSYTIAGTIGWIYVNNGRLPQGIELLRNAVSGDPRNRDVQFQLASALARSDARSEARHILEMLLGDDQRFGLRSEAENLLASLRTQ